MDKRTSEWGTISGLMDSKNVDAVTSVDPRADARCRICSAPNRGVPNGWAVRNLIDELLCVPKSYAAILRLIEPLTAPWPEDARISRYSLMRHARSHLAWEQSSHTQDRRATCSGGWEG